MCPVDSSIWKCVLDWNTLAAMQLSSLLAAMDGLNGVVRKKLPHVRIFHETYRLITERMGETPQRFEDPDGMADFAKSFADLYLKNVEAHLAKQSVGPHWQRLFHNPPKGALLQLWAGARTHIVYDYLFSLKAPEHPSVRDLREMEQLQRELIPEMVALLRAQGSGLARLGQRLPFLASWGYLPVKFWRAGALRRAKRTWLQAESTNALS